MLSVSSGWATRCGWNGGYMCEVVHTAAWSSALASLSRPACDAATRRLVSNPKDSSTIDLTISVRQRCPARHPPQGTFWAASPRLSDDEWRCSSQGGRAIQHCYKLQWKGKPRAGNLAP
jgi:hypothetical protein